MKRIVLSAVALSLLAVPMAEAQTRSGWGQEQRIGKRHGLRQPGKGQQWVRAGNGYVLIAVTSGIIGSLIGGR